jgi:ADP-dependent NAD(P)H-hydrate dehydratase
MEVVRSIPRLPPRPADSHKGTFGRVLVVAGSIGMTGAAALVGRAALRAGAGLVRVATAKSALPIVAAIEASYTTLPLPEDTAGRVSSKALNTILNAAEEHDLLAVGPGLGQSAGLRSVVETLVQQKGLRLLIDGDGLNNLSKLANWPKRRQAELILTPHPGEMKRLWSGLFREDMPRDRQETATRVAQTTGAVVALKGAGTIVSDGGRIYVNTTGNPGMATAGSGDVLTGVTTALAAGRLGQVSLIATDLIDALPEAFQRTAQVP